MLSWGLAFLLIALVAALLGFGALAGTAAWAAKIVFIVAIVVWILSLFTNRRPPL